MNKINKIVKNKERILIIVAHPDDFEDYFGGMFLGLFHQKIIDPEQCSLLVCTKGQNGGRDKHSNSEKLSELRVKEQESALSYLNIPISNLTFLDYCDGFVHNEDNRLLKDIVKMFRLIKPDLICTHNAEEKIIEKPGGSYVVHRDHRVIASTVLDAMYPYSRDVLFFSEQLRNDGEKGHTVVECIMSETSNSNITVDVTKYRDKKAALLWNFKSQFDSKGEVYDYIEKQNKQNGKYIESFRHIKLIE